MKYSVPLLPFHVVQTTSGNGIVLTWQTVMGRTYQLQSATALNPAGGATAWSNVGSPVTVSSASSLSYTNTSPTAAAMYYRVVAH